MLLLTTAVLNSELFHHHSLSSCGVGLGRAAFADHIVIANCVENLIISFEILS